MTLNSRDYYYRYFEETVSAKNVQSQGPVSGKWSHSEPFPPSVPLGATPHLAYTATEVSTHIGGWGQLYGGLHATQVEQRVQVETLALSWRGAQHRAPSIHP